MQQPQPTRPSRLKWLLLLPLVPIAWLAHVQFSTPSNWSWSASNLQVRLARATPGAEPTTFQTGWDKVSYAFRMAGLDRRLARYEGGGNIETRLEQVDESGVTVGVMLRDRNGNVLRRSFRLAYGDAGAQDADLGDGLSGSAYWSNG